MTALLIVEDNRDTCVELSRLLAAPDRQLDVATNADEAMARARAHPFDVVVAELQPSPDASGADMLRAFRATNPGVRVVVLSGLGALDSAVEALKAGAYDYVGKPFNEAALKATIDRAIAEDPPGLLPTPAEPTSTPVGRSPAMLHLYKQIAQAAPAGSPALIIGESGTGKEIVARALHEQGPRQGRPFRTLNCAGVTDARLEAELFGTRRANGTGPDDEPGVLAEVRDGTLLLDSVSELSPNMQALLLAILQDRQVRRPGSDVAVRVEARIIAATTPEIENALAKGTFRQDLFFRLAVFLIRVPPLRERRPDIPLLADHFARAASLRAGRAVSFSTGAIARLRQRDWPGNVRELENMVERLVASARGPIIEATDVVVESLPPAPAGTHPFADMPTLDELERRYLVYALQRFQGNRTRTAAALGIDRRTLYRMSARLGVPITGSELHASRLAAG